MRGSDSDNERVVALEHVVWGYVLADFGVDYKLDPFRFHDFPTAINHGFVELEAGDAVAQQTADVGVFLVDGNPPASPAQSDCRGKACRPRANHRGVLTVFLRGRTRLDPSVGEGGFDNELFALPNHNRFFIELSHAAGLAERWANARGKLGEIAVDGQQLVRALHIARGDSAILIGHEVSERTPAPVAEG